MKISDEDEYQAAIAEMQRLAGEPQDDSTRRRRLELEAAAALYSEQLEGEGHRKGRPKLD